MLRICALATFFVTPMVKITSPEVLLGVLVLRSTPEYSEYLVLVLVLRQMTPQPLNKARHTFYIIIKRPLLPALLKLIDGRPLIDLHMTSQVS
jgi:hypothetical protein